MIKLLLMFGNRLLKFRFVQILIAVYLLYVVCDIAGLSGGTFALILLGLLLVVLFFYRGNVLGGYAYYLHARGYYSKAMRLYPIALANGCKNHNIYLTYGMLKLNNKEYEEAKKLFEWVINNKPKDKFLSSAKSNLSIVYWKEGNLDKAIEIARGLLKDFKTTNVYVNLGYYLMQKGDMEEALRINEEGLEFNSDSAGVLDNLGQIYMLKGEMEKAGDYFIKAAEKGGTIADICFDYGTYLERTGRIEEALEQYEKALKCEIKHINTITENQVKDRIEAIKGKI